ncbi:hypothetical protein GCM10022409_30680 [Hymenobacter glaciei]|uniref:Uncharacterized protein n=1 Tax=Hymenobacter glaciei TaxID=877209 RepID=A0ABP7UFZ4_9BACT
MTPEHRVYLNGHYFDTLYDSDTFSDRPEPYRRQERSLWTVYQLLLLGTHDVTITLAAKQPVFQTRNALEFSVWVQQVYPDYGFVNQFQQPIHTRFPHRADYL